MNRTVRFFAVAAFAVSFCVGANTDAIATTPKVVTLQGTYGSYPVTCNQTSFISIETQASFLAIRRNTMGRGGITRQDVVRPADISPDILVAMPGALACASDGTIYFLATAPSGLNEIFRVDPSGNIAKYFSIGAVIPETMLVFDGAIYLALQNNQLVAWAGTAEMKVFDARATPTRPIIPVYLRPSSGDVAIVFGATPTVAVRYDGTQSVLAGGATENSLFAVTTTDGTAGTVLWTDSLGRTQTIANIPNVGAYGGSYTYSLGTSSQSGFVIYKQNGGLTFVSRTDDGIQTTSNLGASPAGYPVGDVWGASIDANGNAGFAMWIPQQVSDPAGPTSAAVLLVQNGNALLGDVGFALGVSLFQMGTLTCFEGGGPVYLH